MGKNCFYMRLLRHFIPRNDNLKNPQSVIASVARQSLPPSLRAQHGNLIFIIALFYTRLLRLFIPRNDKCKIPQSVIASIGNLATNSIKKRPERFGSLFFILG